MSLKLEKEAVDHLPDIPRESRQGQHNLGHVLPEEEVRHGIGSHPVGGEDRVNLRVHTGVNTQLVDPPAPAPLTTATTGEIRIHVNGMTGQVLRNAFRPYLRIFKTSETLSQFPLL